MSPGYASSTSLRNASINAAAASSVDIFGIARWAVSLVATAPGMNEQTNVPWGRNWARNAWVMEYSAALDAQYVAMPGWLTRLRIDKTLTIAPPPLATSIGAKGSADCEVAEVVDLDLVASPFVVGGADRRGVVVDAGVVDQHRHVGARRRGGIDRGLVGDVEMDRLDMWVGQADLGVGDAGRRVDLGDTRIDERLRGRLADFATGAGDEDDCSVEIHQPTGFPSLVAHAFINPFVGSDSSTSFLAVSMPGDRQPGGIEHADLHQHRRLVPIDVLVVQLVAAEVDDGDQRNLDVLAGRRDTRQHPVDLRVWVKQNSISSTRLVEPIVREIGISLVSSGFALTKCHW